MESSLKIPTSSFSVVERYSSNSMAKETASRSRGMISLSAKSTTLASGVTKSLDRWRFCQVAIIWTVSSDWD